MVVLNMREVLQREGNHYFENSDVTKLGNLEFESFS